MEIDLDIESIHQFELTTAILIYGNGKEGVATKHQIISDQLNPESLPLLGPGQCLTRDMLTDLLRNLTRADSGRTILPERVLCADAALMAWWSPAKRAPIYFRMGDATFNAAISGKEVLHPPLLFVAKAGRLWVWALPSNQRPTLETELMRAPYGNLYETGSMCIGNAFVPQLVSVSQIDVWERAFYETNFTHSNYGSLPVCSHPDKHNGLWTDLAEPSLTEFPFEHLIPIGLSVSNAINETRPKKAAPAEQETLGMEEDDDARN